jgi:predicted acyltransferase (DUF342 family)
VGVFFYSFDGFSAPPGNFPIFTAHFSMSTDQGATFTDTSLLTFQSPQVDDGDPRQRVLGDYQQLKSLDTCFHGAFTANGQPLGRPFADTDAIYFKVCAAQANACVFASQNLTLKDRDQVTAPVIAGSFLSLGSAAKIIDNPAVNGNAFMADQSVVQGNLTLHGTLQHQNTFTITGTLTQNVVDVMVPTLITKTFTVGTGNQSVANGAVVTLAPGNFGNMTFGAGAQVTLAAGTYDFASLNIQPGVKVIANGVVNVNVQGALTVGDRDNISASSPESLTLYTNGSAVTVGTDVTFTGVLVAPTAAINVSSRLMATGCLGGKNLTIDTDAKLNSGGATLPTTN